MPAHQHAPWASGQRKPPPSGRRPQGSPWTRQAKKHWKKVSRKTGRWFDHHPTASLVLTLVLGAVAIVLTITGLFATQALYAIADGTAALSGLAAARARYLAEQRRAADTRIPKQDRGAHRAEPTAPPSNPGEPRPGPILCTRTGKVAKDCDCATRHVDSEAGRRRYGGDLGDPIGAKKKG